MSNGSVVWLDLIEDGIAHIWHDTEGKMRERVPLSRLVWTPTTPPEMIEVDPAGSDGQRIMGQIFDREELPPAFNRYRTKPCEIDAMPITEALFDDPHPNPNHLPGVRYDPVERCVYIETLEGTMRGDLGDYIIRGLEGELYPCKPSAFRAKYESV